MEGKLRGAVVIFLVTPGQRKKQQFRLLQIEGTIKA
jgi:hypothetical protein